MTTAVPAIETGPVWSRPESRAGAEAQALERQVRLRRIRNRLVIEGADSRGVAGALDRFGFLCKAERMRGQTERHFWAASFLFF